MKNKNENGAIMIEALIVYVVTTFLLFFILAVFCVLFQRWNIQTIANEAVMRVAQTYRFYDTDVTTGEYSLAELDDTSHYRYMFYSSDMEANARRKITEYAKNRLKKTTFTKDVTEPVFIVKTEHDGLARRHLTLTIKGEYAVPFGEALSFFGFPGTTVYEVTARAQCLDLSDYITTVNYVKSRISLSDLNGSLIKTINTFLGLLKDIKGHDKFVMEQKEESILSPAGGGGGGSR